MTQNINNLLTPIRKNNSLLTHRDSDPRFNVEGFGAVFYIEKYCLLVKAESNNSKPETRSKLLMFFDLESGEVRGGSLSFSTNPKAEPKPAP